MQDGNRARDGLGVPTGLGSKIDTLLRRRVTETVADGVGALFMSEELVKRVLDELRLPRELLNTVVAHTAQARRGVSEVVRNEVRRFLESAMFSEQLQKLLTSMVFEVRTEIRLVPAKDGSLAPKRRSSVKVRRAKKARG
jgi:uncharacterized membrane-anchored protein YjiN (DUF445 family)